MKDINGREVKPGMLVRWQHTREGRYSEGVQDRTVRIDGVPFGIDPISGGDITLEILLEPRPDEPTGLGAVVEAASTERPDVREKWVRARCERHQWRPEKGYASLNLDLYVPWEDLIDPVVLSEGWTGDE